MNVLLVQTSFLGDNILSTPVIKAIKAKHPNSSLTILTTPLAKPIYELNPDVSRILVYDKYGNDAGILGAFRMAMQLRKLGFSKVYSLHRSFRTALLLFISGIKDRVGFKNSSGYFLYTTTKYRTPEKHDVLRNLEIIEKFNETEGKIFELDVVAPSISTLREDLRALTESTSKYAILAPGSVWATKRWKWEGFREVAKYLIERNITVVISGSKEDSEIAQKISQNLPIVNLVGKTSMSETIALVANAGLVVCNDSMILHLASSFKIPNVVIFCATSPSFGFGPWQNNNSIIVEKQGLNCKPCRRHGSHICPTGTSACMIEVSSVEVISAINKLLNLQ